MVLVCGFQINLGIYPKLYRIPTKWLGHILKVRLSAISDFFVVICLCSGTAESWQEICLDFKQITTVEMFSKVQQITQLCHTQESWKKLQTI